MPPKKTLSKTKPEPKKRSRSATTPVKKTAKVAKAEGDASAPAKAKAVKAAAKKAPVPAPAPKKAAATKAAAAPAAPKKKAAAPQGPTVARRVPGRGDFSVFEDYHFTLNQTNVGENNNKYYIGQVLVDGAGNFALYTEWARVGAPNPQNAFQQKIPQGDAIAGFKDKFSAKTGNQWSNRNNFVKKEGKYQLVLVEGGDDEDGDGSAPLGKLTKEQLEKSLETLDELAPYLQGKNAGSNTVEITHLSSLFYSLFPTDIGFKSTAGMKLDSMDKVNEKKGRILFLMKMAFGVSNKKGKAAKKAAPKVPAKTAAGAPAASVKEESDDDEEEGENKLSGVMALPVPKTLKESLDKQYEYQANSAVTSSAMNEKQKSGKQIKPMNKEQIASIKLYTGSFYGCVNSVLRDSNRKACAKFFKYIRLLADACDCLEQKKITVWRGIGCDLSEQYKVGKTITWWAISSVTTSEQVAKNFSKQWSGNSTLCTIKTKTAVEIDKLSFFPSEKELLLMPGTLLKVIKAEKAGNIFKVELEEVGNAMRS